MKHKNTAYINRTALVNNYRTIEQIAKSENPAVRMIAVVKANAYGHGIDLVSAVLGDAGCSFFAVSSEEEAVELRALENRFGRHPDILILGRADPDNIAFLLENDIICAVVCAENARLLSDAVSVYNEENGTAHALRIHVKLDTGMNRVGFAADEDSIAETVEQIAALTGDKNLRPEGIFTHFAAADDDLADASAPAPDSLTAKQTARWERALDLLEHRGVDCGVRHAANSAAALGLPSVRCDAVRAGIALYGLMPDGTIDPRFAPVMTFSSTVVQIHRVKKGESVGYGGTFTAERDMNIATVAAGYGDGFERRFAGCTVKIRGHEVRVIGRICMDQFMADVTDFADIDTGDRVILFGGDDGTMIAGLARRGDTIHYEIVCGITQRVARVPED